jgi:hypothetical protein
LLIVITIALLSIQGTPTMDNNETNTTPEAGKSRRSFIKKSSIAAGITIIPASNVWGACNVSGVSGGSQSVNTTCIVTPFSGGRSPGTWQKFVKHVPSEQDINRIATILSDVNHNDIFGSSGQKKTKFYYPILKAFIFSQTITIVGNGIGTIRDKVINVGNAVGNNSTPLEKHIACTYLNGLFGMNSGLSAEFTGFDGNKRFIEHIWGSAEINGASSVNSILKAAYDSKKITEATLSTVLGI